MCFFPVFFRLSGKFAETGSQQTAPTANKPKGPRAGSFGLSGERRFDEGPLGSTRHGKAGPQDAGHAGAPKG